MMNASSSALHIDLALRLRWYEIRDMLCGRNQVKQDVKRALELASSCAHPDAVYLTELFAGKSWSTKAEAQAVFLEQGDNDARALCFSEMIMDPDHRDWTCVHLSAELGFAFAQSCIPSAMIKKFHLRNEAFTSAMRAALQGERDGFHLLGLYFEHGEGCDKDLERAKQSYCLASKLGHVAAMRSYGQFFEESESQHWVWLGRAASRGSDLVDFTKRFSKRVKWFLSASERAPILFAIGRGLKGYFNTDGFESSFRLDFSIPPAILAIKFYIAQLSACRKSVDAWSIVGIRCGVVKDIRIMVGMMIWDSRDLAKHNVCSELRNAA